jgi:hypothetical protein
MKKASVPISIGIAFIVSCVISTFINQSFREFGYKNCSKLEGEARDVCDFAVKKDAESGYAWNLFGIWFIASFVVHAMSKEK